MPDIRVTFFGDSLVAGVGDESGLGWPGRLVAAAASAGTPVCAYNLGVRRETSADVLARWESELAPRLESGAESRLVFSFGVNDATWEDGEPRVRPAQSAAHLDRVLDRARAWSLPALVVGPPPVADDAQRERIAALSVAFGHVTAERGVPYVALADALGASAGYRRELEAGDGAHPGGSGYTLIAERVIPAWLAWLAGAAPAAS